MSGPPKSTLSQHSFAQTTRYYPIQELRSWLDSIGTGTLPISICCTDAGTTRSFQRGEVLARRRRVHDVIHSVTTSQSIHNAKQPSVVSIKQCCVAPASQIHGASCCCSSAHCDHCCCRCGRLQCVQEGQRAAKLFEIVAMPWPPKSSFWRQNTGIEVGLVRMVFVGKPGDPTVEPPLWIRLLAKEDHWHHRRLVELRRVSLHVNGSRKPPGLPGADCDLSKTVYATSRGAHGGMRGAAGRADPAELEPASLTQHNTPARRPTNFDTALLAVVTLRQRRDRSHPPWRGRGGLGASGCTGAQHTSPHNTVIYTQAHSSQRRRSLSVPREIAIFDQHRFINLLPYEVTSTHPIRRCHDSSSFMDTKIQASRRASYACIFVG